MKNLLAHCCVRCTCCLPIPQEANSGAAIPASQCPDPALALTSSVASPLLAEEVGDRASQAEQAGTSGASSKAAAPSQHAGGRSSRLNSHPKFVTRPAVQPVSRRARSAAACCSCGDCGSLGLAHDSSTLSLVGMRAWYDATTAAPVGIGMFPRRRAVPQCNGSSDAWLVSLRARRVDTGILFFFVSRTPSVSQAAALFCILQPLPVITSVCSLSSELTIVRASSSSTTLGPPTSPPPKNLTTTGT